MFLRTDESVYINFKFLLPQKNFLKRFILECDWTLRKPCAFETWLFVYLHVAQSAFPKCVLDAPTVYRKSQILFIPKISHIFGCFPRFSYVIYKVHVKLTLNLETLIMFQLFSILFFVPWKGLYRFWARVNQCYISPDTLQGPQTIQ